MYTCILSFFGHVILMNKELATLPPIPAHTHTLYCRNNNLTTLGQLPHKIRHLDCCNNKLTTLGQLPPKLRVLRCSYNNIVFQPSDRLPEGLLEFDCRFNDLKVLPMMPLSLEPTLTKFDMTIELYKTYPRLNVLMSTYWRYKLNDDPRHMAAFKDIIRHINATNDAIVAYATIAAIPL